MCTGAVTAAKIDRVVIGATWADAPGYFKHPEKGSLLSVAAHTRYPFQYETGVLRSECARLYAT
jgi:tRNA(Arg) A34 adenosine deaminase TadA